jgi:putative N6-adenine-specific DNA methylase/tRNA (guanine6-N2)-methyltransferase
MYCYHVRTNPGLEPLLADEIVARIPDSATILRPFGRAGWVECRRTSSQAAAQWRRLRLAYEVVEVRAAARDARLTADNPDVALQAVSEIAGRAPFPEITSDTSIAARCLRTGSHSFHSPDAERAAGTAVVTRYRCPVNLRNPRMTVRADIHDDTLVAGLLLTPDPLDRRFTWVYRPRITLSTPAAAALLWTAEDAPPGALLDPFCGSGTIPLEAAAQMHHTGTMSPAPVYASDLSPEAVAGTRANLALNGLKNRVCVRTADATDLARRYTDRGVTRIVCNPPYGVRLGRRLDFSAFYSALLDGAAKVLPPDGLLVLMSSRRRGRLNAVVKRSEEWSIARVVLIETGGVYPGIFVLRRR